MSPCHQERCAFWTGGGCVCEVLDVPRGQRLIDPLGHHHRAYVDGCFRCELNKDETDD
jgi:hypothetical protein